MNHTGVPKRVSFSLEDVEITEIASGKLVAKGSANHHAKSYEFSHFVADANPTTLLTHGNQFKVQGSTHRFWSFETHDG